MAKSTSELLVGGTGSIYVAPYGTTAPTSLAAIGGGYVELGYTSDEGVTFTDEKTIVDIRVWQRFYPARKIVTERNAMVSFQLAQWNTDTVLLAFGGGDVTEPSNNIFRYSPPPPGELDERVCVVDVVDGDKNYRIVLPRCIVIENVETQYVRTINSVLPITLGIVAPDDEDEDPWYFLTDDEDAFRIGS